MRVQGHLCVNMGTRVCAGMCAWGHEDARVKGRGDVCAGTWGTRVRGHVCRHVGRVCRDMSMCVQGHVCVDMGDTCVQGHGCVDMGDVCLDVGDTCVQGHGDVRAVMETRM